MTIATESARPALAGTEGRYLANEDIVEACDAERVRLFDRLPDNKRSAMGQYGTPPPVARLMAEMFGRTPKSVRILDAGAGVGTLTAALIAELLSRSTRPKRIHLTAVESEPLLISSLMNTLGRCQRYCEGVGVECAYEIVEEDFVEYAVDGNANLFGGQIHQFDCAIQNPPYRKISSSSKHRVRLREMDIEVSNLYAAFVALTSRLLAPGGQLVAITPRSFCNGPYFNSFRSDLLGRMSLSKLHVFESRSKAFGGDGVLQENVIFHGVVGKPPPETVRTTSSSGGPKSASTIFNVPYDIVVPPNKEHPAIHLVTDESALGVAERMKHFACTLSGLGLTVSTGRVVDFRVKEHLRAQPEKNSVPLIYPMHLRAGAVRWPVRDAKKSNALALRSGTQSLVVPSGFYVLVKRFSSKEQRRRIDAYVYDSETVCPGPVGFENHLNYIHADGRGVEAFLARGLSVYLNSTLVDMYFRLFSGHTQVNATDLRNTPFPDVEALRRLGRRMPSNGWNQQEIDDAFSKELLKMARTATPDPVATNKRVLEAQTALKEFGFPRKQTNVRSALVLLALLNLKQDEPWGNAKSPLLGITEMMNWFAAEYGKTYAPNSRETVRRQTVHQFLEAGLVVQNPDDPGRPVNSGKNVYQIIPEALDVLQAFGAQDWDDKLALYLAQAGSLSKAYAQQRQMQRIPLTLNDGETLSLSPGGQNVLVERIVEEFIPRFAPGGRAIYVGDTEDKWAHFDESAFTKLGLKFDTHGKFPDVIVHYTDKNWLLLIEAVTSHGPVDPKRHQELSRLFKGAACGLVFVTTFLNRKDFGKYLSSISWETEVWVADSPGHMIHFDGKRFLGPYQS